MICITHTEAERVMLVMWFCNERTIENDTQTSDVTTLGSFGGDDSKSRFGSNMKIFNFTAIQLRKVQVNQN